MFFSNTLTYINILIFFFSIISKIMTFLYYANKEFLEENVLNFYEKCKTIVMSKKQAAFKYKLFFNFRLVKTC